MDQADEPKGSPGARRIDVTPRGDPVASALRCPFCHDPVHLEVPTPWVACAACLARHHGSCWKESGRCGACAHERRLRPDTGRRGWLRLLGAAVGGSVLTLLVAAGVQGAHDRRRYEERHAFDRFPDPPPPVPASEPPPVAPPTDPLLEASLDLGYVQVGQRYIYEMQNNMQQVWTVLEVHGDSVIYEMQMILGGNPLGDSTRQEWRHFPPAPGARPSTPPQDVKLTRERVSVSGIEFDCMVTEASGYKSWTPMAPGSETVPVFPGFLKTVQLSDHAVICELKKIEPPR